MKLKERLAILAGLVLLLSFHGAAQAAIFTTGLSMWLDANSGVTTSGSNVTSWTDLTGNGHNATQSTAGDQPTFVSNGLNGNPTVQFNGIADSLSIAGQPITSQQFTILAVLTNSNSSTFDQEVLFQLVL